jgi:regulator of sigma E protease
MNLVSSLYQYGIPFVVVITPLIFVHELGHFLLARWNGVRVEVFSIGFGRELFGWTDKHQTRWKISILPLGGYVKMFGQVEPDLGSGAAADMKRSGPPAKEFGTEAANGPAFELTEHDKAVSYNHKKIWQRAAISFAGPAANLVFAVLVLAIVFATVGQQLTSTKIDQVTPGSAAEAAGLQKGDTILSANGEHLRRFEDLAALVGLGLDEPLKLQVKRGDQVIEIDARPKIIETTDIFGNKQRIGQLGVGHAGGGEIVHYDPLTALWVATTETYSMGTQILKSLGQIITGARPASEVSGVISIVKMSGNVFSQGFFATVSWIVFISINLGLINLFPIPLLDGGHLMFNAIEAISGRKPGPKAEEWSMRVGLALVLSLMLFATWNDLVRSGVIRFIASLFA